MRIAEVDRQIGVDPELGVLSHLRALVPGQRSSQLFRQGRNRSGDRVANSLGAVACESGAVLGAGKIAVAIHPRQVHQNGESTFYSTIWGGEDIHIGLYNDEADSIATASRRSVERLARHLEPLDKSSRVLDMGSGYGGTSRYLASTYGCHVVGLNLSEVENERARRLNEEQGLADRIDIVDGSFESVDAESGSFDAACSQDAFLHSGELRGQVSDDYLHRMKQGLVRWVEGGEKGYLVWGTMTFRKKPVLA